MLSNNQKGFSLAEMMVAAGMLGVLAVGTMQLTKTSTTSLKRTEASVETQLLTQTINQYLLNGESCKNTFEPAGSLAVGTEISEIRNRNNEVSLNTTDIYGGRAIKINSMKIGDPFSPNDKGFVEFKLEVIFERLSSEIKDAAKFITREIPLNAQVDPSSKHIIKCYATTENAVDTAKLESCQSIGGFFDNDLSACFLTPYKKDPLDSTPAQEYPKTAGRKVAVSTDYLKEYGDEHYVNVEGDKMTGALEIILKEKNLNALDVKGEGSTICINGNCRNFEETTCQVGSIVKKIKNNGQVECVALKCPPNRFFHGLDQANGIPICKPLPTEKCGTNQYIVEIKENGDVVCKDVPFYWGTACNVGEYIREIDINGSPTCVKIPTEFQCPDGQFIYRQSAGNFYCRAVQEDKHVYGKSCPLGQVLIGFDSAGNPRCQDPLSQKACLHSWSCGCSKYGCSTCSQMYQHGEIFNSVLCGCSGATATQCIDGAFKNANFGCVNRCDYGGGGGN